MTDMTDQPIEQIVGHFKNKVLSRGGLIAALASVGVTAAGIGTILSTVESDAATSGATDHGHKTTEHHNKRLHHHHVRRQSTSMRPGVVPHGVTGAEAVAANPALERHLQTILDDYADDAVVEDPLFATPFIGKEAIRARKLAEMGSMRGFTLDVVHRIAHRDQVVAEWVARGAIQGDFLGFVGNGRPIEMRGVTIATRKNGKIVKESLYYDLTELRRQLS